MEPTEMDLISQKFAGRTVEIVISDVEGKDQAPTVRKMIKKVLFCPDNTHIRFYFDDIYFLAVPVSAEFHWTEMGWSASDLESGLTYTVNGQSK